MDLKIIRLITTRYDIVDWDNSPIVESTIIGVVDVHEDITELVDLYHERYRDDDDDDQRIETQVIKLSTVEELLK